MRKLLKLSHVFGQKKKFNIDSLHVTFNLAFFTGSAESHCVTLDCSTYIRILKPGICLIFTFGWFNVTIFFFLLL